MDIALLGVNLPTVPELHAGLGRHHSTGISEPLQAGYWRLSSVQRISLCIGEWGW
jgi:hypothetical protein